MSEEATKDLERDAERVRAQISDTAEQLKDKMSPGQLMDEVVNYFKDGDTNQLLGNLKHQVRDNPLALALVGSGLAWLMMGSGSTTTTAPERNPLSGDGADRRPLAGSNTYGGPVGSNRAPSPRDPSLSATTDSGLGGTAASFGGKVSDAASSATGAATRAMHDLRDSAADSFGRASDAGSATVHRVQSTFLDALDREPLVLGALGVAVGAAIGAMLPPTKLEKDYLGEASSSVREGAEELITDTIDKAKDVGTAVYRAARDEADSEGLMPHGKPVAERLSNVATAAGHELKAAAVDTVEKAESVVDDTNEKWSPRNRS